MNIAEQLNGLADRMQRKFNNTWGEAQVAGLVAELLTEVRTLSAECADKVLVAPTTWGGVNLVQRYATICVPPARVFTSGTTLACGDTTSEAIANLQGALDRKGKPDHIEASQAETQALDAVQVPREVYNAALNRLGYAAIYLVPEGHLHDIVVREHERLKMCDSAPIEASQAGGQPPDDVPATERS